MAQQMIGIGAAPNDGTGDTLRDAGDKINDNFTELYAGLTGLLDFKGSTDCSANPNYPAASKGDIYIVSVAGKIGGASGKVVEVGDFYLALADNAGGAEASVGTSWAVLQANIAGGAVISELDDIPDVNAPTPANGDVLTWDSTPGEWVSAAPTGGSNALDDLTDVDAPTPSDGDVLTFDSGSGDWVPAAPGGGSEWALEGGSYTAAGVWRQTNDGNVSAATFTGLSGAADILIICKDVTKSVSGQIVVQVSVDNGSNWFTTSGDYAAMSDTGTLTNSTGLFIHNTGATAARNAEVMIMGANTTGTPKSCFMLNRNSHFTFRGSTSPINAVRAIPSGGGNFTGGEIFCQVR